ncbi:FAD-linked oxidase C-terminal domain-containing protein [Comamonadaceae bacterium SL12-8]|uniref:FAD-linked oxidase C-terminal domain-containing protein n=2 Tax=Amphibiibacter pelophylacis TaxID=1799477 RepID=A0ACC6P074_9BURK
MRPHETLLSVPPCSPSTLPETWPEGAAQELARRLGERCVWSQAVREQHGRDESPFVDVPPPDAVVMAQSVEDVSAVLAWAQEFGVPVIPFAAGSSLEGHVLAVQGGVSLDVNALNAVHAIHTEDMTATVGPGLTRKQLNAALGGTGLFFPIDPGADASIGGMAATRASGTNAVRYGTLRENVLALQVVLPGGEVIRTGTRARKSSAGYDLTRLMVGSEGTLGVITEVTVRLHPLPEAVSAAVCAFPSVLQAVQCTTAIIQAGIPIARVELLDAATVGRVNRHAGLTLPQKDLLLMEFHGSPASVAEQAQAVQGIAEDLGGLGFDWATRPEERSRLWAARHNAYFAGVQSRPGCRVITTDVCVPISRLAEAVQAAVDEADAAGQPYFLVGHVGDGNFHMGYLVDPHDADEIARAEALNRGVVERAIAASGTCTGEHGIGLHKRDFLRQEAGEAGVALMRAIKAAIDPKNIMNPGKVV